MSEKIKTIIGATFFDINGNHIPFKSVPREEEVRISGIFYEEALTANPSVHLEKANCILKTDGYVVLTFTDQKFNVIPEEMQNIENAIDIKFESFVILAKNNSPYENVTDENITIHCKDSYSRKVILNIINSLICDPNLNVFLKGNLYQKHYNAKIQTSVIYTTPITEIIESEKNGKRRLFVKTKNSWYRLLIFNERRK